MLLNSISCSVIGKHALDMQRASLEALVISVATHVVVIALIGNLGVSSCLLRDPDRQQGEGEDDEDADPGPVSGQGMLCVRVRKQIMKHVDVVLKVITCFCNIDWAVLAVEQIDIEILELFLLVLLLTHEVEGVVLVIEVGGVLGAHGDNTHVNGQAEEPALEKKVHVSVYAGVRAPVIHLQLVHQGHEHGLEHRIVLRAHEHFPFVDLLHVQVAVNRNVRSKSAK